MSSIKILIIKLLLFQILFIELNSQLSVYDKESIEKFILQGQSKSTGLFFEDFDVLKHTREAINILKILELEVKHKTEI